MTARRVMVSVIAGMLMLGGQASTTETTPEHSARTRKQAQASMESIEALFVPVILTASGQNNSFFTSELTLTNRGGEEATLHYTYTANTGGGSGTATDRLAPGRQKIEPDALKYLRRLGIPIPHSGNRLGTLQVEISGSSDLGVSVRTTTSVPEGRAGLAYPAVAIADGFTEAVYLCGLRQNSQDRSNVAFQNMGTPEQGSVTLRTTVFSGDAENRSTRVLPDVILAPGGFHQYSGILNRAGFDNGYVKVERVEGATSFYAYGVINDQVNSDGSFVFPVTASSLAGTTRQTVPVIVETGVFTSELTLTNFSDVAKTVTLCFRAEAVRTPDKTATAEWTLQPGQQVIVPEIVEVMRHRGAPGIGPSGQIFAGAFFATVAEGDMSGIAVAARTSSADGRGGQYGVSYNAVPDARAFTRSVWVDGLQQNRKNRSNLALVNTGEIDDSSSIFQLDIYDGATGELANTVLTPTVHSREWRQINGILRQSATGTTQGYVRISRISGNNPFLAYGVVNDGGAPGERSGDGAYLPALEAIIDPGTRATDHHAALTAGLPERPFLNTTVGGSEGSTFTVGTLRLGLNLDVFPVVVDLARGVLVAGSTLGSGRVVAFSGQDFLGSNERATLLGHKHLDRLLANAVRWTAGVAAKPIRVLADNQRIVDALEAQGLRGIKVVGGTNRQERDWRASALEDVDVAVVQVNEWGTPRLVEEFVAPLRAFVEGGGGLVIAGSAVHWSWWIEGHRAHGPFAGNALLRGSGISWNRDYIDEIGSSTTTFDLRALSPGIQWGDYINGGLLDATQLLLLPGLFSAALEIGRLEELNTALARLVRETPLLPVSAHAPEARLAANVASSLGPHEWPEAHPWATTFPGLPSPGANRESGSVVVDATGGGFPDGASRDERHFPLEFYASPSSLVTISVPWSHATGELAITVGQEHNDLHLIPSHTVWRRPPALRRTFKITTAETAVTNAYGGSLALVVPESYRETIPVTVQGAIPMAVYTAGESNAAEWFAALSAGAPQAIIQKPGGIRFVISADAARGITGPGEVSAFWDGFRRHHADLSGEPAPRAFESTWIFDPQVGYGYANAGRLAINYPLHGEAWVLVPGTAEGRDWISRLPSEGPKRYVLPLPGDYIPAAHGVDWWLFGHELGHQWQTEDWGRGSTYRDIGEVAVNLFTMYTLNKYLFGGGDTDIISMHGMPNSVDHAALSHLRWPTADYFEKLQMYRQLIFEFGWEAVKAVFRSYYDPAYPRSTFGGELDGFAIRFSAIVQRDLVGFFRHWEYPLSESAEATIRSFGLEAWLPPGWESRAGPMPMTRWREEDTLLPAGPGASIGAQGFVTGRIPMKSRGLGCAGR